MHKSKNVEVIIAIVLMLLLPIIALATPTTTFNTPPTPTNGATQTSTTATINATITEGSLGQFTFSWNSTNYTFFNNSLLLMLNLNNVGAIGESSALAVDVSKYGNNATVYSTATPTTSGKYGGAYNFPGDSGYILAADNAIDVSGDFTVEAWINPSAINVQQGIMEKDGITDTNHEYTAEFDIEARSNNALWFEVGSSTAWTWSRTTSATQLQTGNWYYLVAVMNGTTMRLYINGNLEDSQVNPYPRRPDGGQGIRIGRSDDTDGINGATYWSGKIDEVRIWKRPLSGAEINQSYNSNFQKYDTNKWEFDTVQSNLRNGTYSYQGFTADSSGIFGNTETRTLTIGSGTVSGLGGSQMNSYGTPEFSDYGIWIAGICSILANFILWKKR